MKSFILLPLLAAALVLGGCNATKTASNPAAQTQGVNKQPRKPHSKPKDSHKMVNKVQPALLGEWAIVSVAGTKLVPNGDVLPSLTLSPNPELNGVVDVIGFNGCNYINGSWQVGSSSLKPTGEFISTLKACPDAPYQQSINQALSQAVAYQLKGNNLSLRDADGKEMMLLRNHNLSYLNGAWKVVSITGKTVNPTINIAVVLDDDQGSIHGSAGCNTLNGKMIPTLERNSGVEFRDLRTTRMTCPDIAVEQAFLLALEQVSSVQHNSDGSITFLNEDGKPIITMNPLNL